ncbi:uncharacterized protein LOC132735668 [Ruditapes philippinarum]|uniref:uncharacterized protein LOC132735668 n=1 Tax=Ruditapes philippinarum TaxID=129788 RepID=UPI00295B87CA|nr:uncharacterized protein LOC132735668 [Ruditapes philippinarum]
MGGKVTKIFTHEQMIEEMRPKLDSLTEKDRRLFDHAVCEVSRESGKLRLQSFRISINFHDTDPVSFESEEDPKSRLVVSYDGYGNPQSIWERESKTRIVYRLMDSMAEDFLNWFREFTLRLAGSSNRMITGF